MNQRIRYGKLQAGRLSSRRNFTTAAGREVNVELDLNTKTYHIKDASTGEQVAVGGNTKNVAVLKIQAKRGLTELGVAFADETRDRGGMELPVPNVIGIG